MTSKAILSMVLFFKRAQLERLDICLLKEASHPSPVDDKGELIPNDGLSPEMTRKS